MTEQITTTITGSESGPELGEKVRAIHEWWFGRESVLAHPTTRGALHKMDALLHPDFRTSSAISIAAIASRLNPLNIPSLWVKDRALPSGAYGMLARGTLPSSVFDSHSGGAVADPGEAIGRVVDQSGNGLTLSQATLSLRPAAGRRPKGGVRNMLVATSALSTQVVAVAAGDYTLSFTGTGSVALSGAATGTLAGTGENDRVSLQIAAGAGILTLTVTGSVTLAQLEAGEAVTPYQAVGADRGDVTEAGEISVATIIPDFVDDTMSAAIAPGLDGQAFVAGVGGCYVTDLNIAPGGSFSIGGTGHNWTGAPSGVLKAVAGIGGLAPGLFDVILRDGGFSDDDLADLATFYRALGSAGLLTPGPELLANGDLVASGPAGWTLGAYSGESADAYLAAPVAAEAGVPHLVSIAIESVDAGSVSVQFMGDSDVASPAYTASGVHFAVLFPAAGTDRFAIRFSNSAVFSASAVSVRALNAG